MPRRLLTRPTIEVVILILTVTVCLIMLSGFLYVGIVSVVRPEQDTFRVAEALIQLLDVIVGGLVGFVAGRSMKRREDEDQSPEA